MKVKKSKQRPLPPEGAVAATIANIVDLGTQETQWGGKRQVAVAFIIDEYHVFDEEKGEEPFMQTVTTSLSMNEKSNLFKITQAALGRSVGDEDFEDGEFDLSQILGKGVLVTITHTEKNGTTYANISNFSALPKKMGHPEVPEKVPQVIFDLDDFDQEVFDSLYEWLQRKIVDTQEYEEATAEGAVSNREEETEEDDLPFDK